MAQRKYDGQGTLHYSGGGEYDGQFLQGARNGRGSLVDAFSNRFEGEWENNELNGQASATYKNGTTYAGQWRNNKYDGPGRLAVADGTVFEGTFKLGKREGEGTLTDPQGRRTSGTWADDAIVRAQDDAEARLAAADRYFRIVPISRVLDDELSAIAKKIPQDKQAEFLAAMKTILQADALQSIARNSMVKNFTTEEINALADFYGSKMGSSILKKFGIYMADVMPQIQAEVARAAAEALTKKPPKGA